MVWYDRDMKKIFITLGAVFSLFSYSSDPLALDVLDGKIFVCTDVYGLNHNLDPSTYDANRQLTHDRMFGYKGFIFNGNEVETQRIYMEKKIDPATGSYHPSKSGLSTAKGYVSKVLPEYIRWNIIYGGNGATYYVINRKNLDLHVLYKENTSFMKSSLKVPKAYCVLAKNREAYDKFMKNMKIKDQEKIDKDNADRKRKLIEGMKDNQI